MFCALQYERRNLLCDFGIHSHLWAPVSHLQNEIVGLGDTGSNIKFSWELLETLMPSFIPGQLNQNPRVRPSCQYFSKFFKWL